MLLLASLLATVWRRLAWVTRSTSRKGRVCFWPASELATYTNTAVPLLIIPSEQKQYHRKNRLPRVTQGILSQVETSFKSLSSSPSQVSSRCLPSPSRVTSHQICDSSRLESESLRLESNGLYLNCDIGHFQTPLYGPQCLHTLQWHCWL